MYAHVYMAYCMEINHMIINSLIFIITTQQIPNATFPCSFRRTRNILLLYKDINTSDHIWRISFLKMISVDLIMGYNCGLFPNQFVHCTSETIQNIHMH